MPNLKSKKKVANTEATEEYKKEQKKLKIFDYIKENYPGPEKSKIDIRHLWLDFYRVNYWNGNTEEFKTNYIVHSIFIKAYDTPDGVLVEEFNN